MIPYRRQQQILAYARERDSVTLDELLMLLPGVSESTIRRDIKALEASHQIERLSGGAIRAYSSVMEQPIATKTALMPQEKKRIAQLAAQQVKAGETIYLDSGSTCTALFFELLDMDIHIVTTNTDVIRNIPQQTTAEVVILGGVYNPTIASLYGSLTEENLRLYVFDKAFLGANGVDVTYGITTPHIEESAKKRVVVGQSKQVFVLADSSKFGHVANTHCIGLSDATIISDKNNEAIAQRTTLIWE